MTAGGWLMRVGLAVGLAVGVTRGAAFAPGATVVAASNAPQSPVRVCVLPSMASSAQGGVVVRYIGSVRGSSPPRPNAIGVRDRGPIACAAGFFESPLGGLVAQKEAEAQALSAELVQAREAVADVRNTHKRDSHALRAERIKFRETLLELQEALTAQVGGRHHGAVASRYIRTL